MSSKVMEDIKAGKGLKPLGETNIMSSKVMEDIKAGKGLKPLGETELINAARAHELADRQKGCRLSKLKQEFRKQIKEEITCKLIQGLFSAEVEIPLKLINTKELNDIIGELQGLEYTVKKIERDNILTTNLKIIW